MRKINWRRVVLGGLLAGVVANVLLSAAWWLFLEKLGPVGGTTQPRPMTAVQLGYFIGPFFAGIVAVGLFAALRPRYGPGLKTAARAGLICWLVTGVVPFVIFFSAVLRFRVPPMEFWIGLATYLMAIIVATIAGAWVYKEQG